MKLIRAEFQNFRLLRDLALVFSMDSEKNLTVIRAENETGKTTILNGLQWALYGDDALPGRGSDYRLHPIDWVASERTQIPISVQIEFEITTYRQKSKGGLIETNRRYRIIRSAHETLDGLKHSRTPSTVKLFQLTDRGSVPIEPPEAWISEELPPELREVFFTDGDRALSFIEATAPVRAKRERVEKAIHSLLGLGVIEDALKHVQKTTSEANKAARKIGTDEELVEIASKLEQIDKDSEELSEKIKDSKSQFALFDQKLSEIQKEIETVLIEGDREQLKRDIERTRQQLELLDKQQIDASKEHSNLFRNLFFSRDLLGAVLEKSLSKLDVLRDQGKIPSTTIPVLEERLKKPTCICGESLDLYDAESKQRRHHIQCLIDESRNSDALQRSITALYFGSNSLMQKEIAGAELWTDLYVKVANRRDELETLRDEQGKKLKALEVQLDSIPDTDIQGLRSVQRQYKNQRDRFNADWTRDETQLEGLKKDRKNLVLQRDNLLRQQKKGARILARLEVASDIEHVLKNSYDRMTNEELDKVSDLMNSIFLEMIGADPEQGAIIQKSEISNDFDILVYGPNERTLNPDRDLNGASRRALTLAFILALTKVSEVEAPNVIDTPLGMMSGFVKRSVLKTTIQKSSQLVLFLTRSEIADCEEILDEYAGQVITLTNPAHYPRMLVNDPQVKERKLLRCDCNHRQECGLCQRQVDVE
ncbi:MAG: AAA family ATPase [Candidatus Poribacteria bacterium]|nr:AAA family ATPase [Candidatus Poribacteria bacterium]